MTEYRRALKAAMTLAKGRFTETKLRIFDEKCSSNKTNSKWRQIYHEKNNDKLPHVQQTNKGLRLNTDQTNPESITNNTNVTESDLRYTNNTDSISNAINNDSQSKPWNNEFSLSQTNISNSNNYNNNHNTIIFIINILQNDAEKQHQNNTDPNITSCTESRPNTTHDNESKPDTTYNTESRPNTTNNKTPRPITALGISTKHSVFSTNLSTILSSNTTERPTTEDVITNVLSKVSNYKESNSSTNNEVPTRYTVMNNTDSTIIMDSNNHNNNNNTMVFIKQIVSNGMKPTIPLSDKVYFQTPIQPSILAKTTMSSIINTVGKIQRPGVKPISNVSPLQSPWNNQLSTLQTNSNSNNHTNNNNDLIFIVNVAQMGEEHQPNPLDERLRPPVPIALPILVPFGIIAPRPYVAHEQSQSGSNPIPQGDNNVRPSAGILIPRPSIIEGNANLQAIETGPLRPPRPSETVPIRDTSATLRPIVSTIAVDDVLNIQTPRPNVDFRPDGSRPIRDRPNENRPSAERPNVNRPSVDRPNGNRPAPDRPNGDQSDEDGDEESFKGALL